MNIFQTIPVDELPESVRARTPEIRAAMAADPELSRPSVLFVFNRGHLFHAGLSSFRREIRDDALLAPMMDRLNRRLPDGCFRLVFRTESEGGHAFIAKVDRSANG
jgi:hypothetical protein